MCHLVVRLHLSSTVSARIGRLDCKQCLLSGNKDGEHPKITRLLDHVDHRGGVEMARFMLVLGEQFCDMLGSLWT